MWRLVVLTALLGGGGGGVRGEPRPDGTGEPLAKRSPVSAYAHGRYVEATAQEIPHEYLALLQRYLEAQQQQPQQRPAAPQKLQHHQAIPLDLEQYHVETSPAQQPQQPRPQPQLYYPAAAHEQPEQPEFAARAGPLPVQYGYEDEQQVQREQHSPEAIVRAQAHAQSAALAFQKVAQASHQRHREAALEQIRLAADKHREQSALEQIRQGESVSEAGLKERLPPKDPEGAYRAQLKAQATALVAEQRRAKEAAEYKAHAEAILALQAQQRAHLRAQEEAHHFALNYEKNQQRAQAQAQAIANAQALALYRARQQALGKAQAEARQAAKAQADARKLDPDGVPVVQYLLPNKVALPPPEVYLPKAAEALRAQEAALAAQEKRQPRKQLELLPLEEPEPGPARRPGAKQPQPEEPPQLAFLVDAAAYYRKPQHFAPEEAEAGRHPAHYQQRVDPDKLALLVPLEA